jgi:hypothetical protein
MTEVFIQNALLLEQKIGSKVYDQKDWFKGIIQSLSLTKQGIILWWWNEKEKWNIVGLIKVSQ